MDKSELRIITPKQSFWYKQAEAAQYDVSEPYVGNSILLRCFRELHFRSCLPGKTLWYNRDNICDRHFFLLDADLLSGKFVRWLHDKNPKGTIAINYLNPVGATTLRPVFADTEWCSSWSSDKCDCKEYGLNHYNGGALFFDLVIPPLQKEFDVFYVGRDKKRLGQLKELASQFDAMGISYYFHVVKPKRLSMNRRIYKKPISYSSVLEYIGKSRSILHLAEGAQRGITMRVIEALLSETKLITDCGELEEYDFYRPNNIFILGKERIESLPSFLEMPYETVEKCHLFDHLYFDDFLDTVFPISKKGESSE